MQFAHLPPHTRPVYGGMNMETNDFEKAFSDFVERREYGEAQNALLGMIRTSFKAGWQAAGGDPPTPHSIFQIIPNNP